METGKLEIDLDVHKAIETRRISLNETQNDILRRVFDLPLNYKGISDAPNQPPSVRASRRGGNYVLQVLGKKIPVQSLKEALRTAVVQILNQNSGFLPLLAKYRTPAVAELFRSSATKSIQANQN